MTQMVANWALRLQIAEEIVNLRREDLKRSRVVIATESLEFSPRAMRVPSTL